MEFYKACGDRVVCPACSAIRVREMRRHYWPLVRAMKHPKMVVLTVKNGLDLWERFTHLMKSFRRLRQRAWWKKRVAGGIYGLEVTYGRGGWHVHLHIIVDAAFLPNRPADKARGDVLLKEEWEAVTGDSYRTEIGAVGDRDCDRQAALYETIKYVGEESKTGRILLSDDEKREVARVLKSVKFNGTFGTLFAAERQLPKDEGGGRPCPHCGSTAGWLSPWQQLDDGSWLRDVLGTDST